MAISSQMEPAHAEMGTNIPTHGKGVTLEPRAKESSWDMPEATGEPGGPGQISQPRKPGNAGPQVRKATKRRTDGVLSDG